MATGRNLDGRLEVFARGNDNLVWQIWQPTPGGGPWSGWNKLISPIQIVSAPAVGQNQDGRLEVFARGDGSALWHIWQTAPNNGWSHWESLGGVLDGGPAVIQNQDGRLEVFARGADKALWHIWQTAPNNGWSNWESLGGPSEPKPRGRIDLVFTPAVGRNLDGRLEVFALGADHTVWHIWQTAPSSGPWSGWNRLPSLAAAPNAISAPAVGQNSDGRLEVFVVDQVGSLIHIWQTAPSNGWTHHWESRGAPWSGSLSTAPAVGQNGDGRLEVFAGGGGNRNLWHIWQTAPNNGWSNWESLGGPTLSDLAVGRNHDGRLEVFILSADMSLQHIWQTAPNNGWSGWESFGGMFFEL